MIQLSGLGQAAERVEVRTGDLPKVTEFRDPGGTRAHISDNLNVFPK